MIFYEAARRLVSCLEDMQTVFGKDRLVFFAHDMTKVHESFFRGELWKLKQDIVLHAPFVKGEVTLVVKGEKRDTDSDALADPGEKSVAEHLIGCAARSGGRNCGAVWKKWQKLLLSPCIGFG